MAAVGRLALVLLVVDGFITALLEVLYLPLYVGSTPLPITVVVAAVVNVGLVVSAARLTGRIAVVGAPLVAWLVGFGVCLLSTRGGSVVLSQHEGGRTLLLLVVGLLPAFALLTRHRIRGLPTVR
jgi:hypothetical protein